MHSPKLSLKIYKESEQVSQLAEQGLKKLEDLKRKKREEERLQIRIKKVEGLVKKATAAVNDKKVEVAEGLFQKILELDPENYDVPQLKIEIDAWKNEQNRLELEREQKKAERKRKVDALKPSESLYLQKEWYKAILKLEDFLKITDMDEDLTLKGTNMLSESRQNLENIIEPLLAKARSLKEGQDLKGAYSNYLKVYKNDPSNTEALNEISGIKHELKTKARKIYREGIIIESLSLFDEAKEKFQEVQQISPTDSEYYIKASKKLKHYLDK